MNLINLTKSLYPTVQIFAVYVLLPRGIWAVAAAIHLLNSQAAPSFSDTQVTKGLKITSWHQCCGSEWIRIQVTSRIRIRKMYGLWAYLSTFSRFWAFIWTLGSGSGSASKWKIWSGSASKWNVVSGAGTASKWKAGSGSRSKRCGTATLLEIKGKISGKHLSKFCF